VACTVEKAEARPVKRVGNMIPAIRVATRVSTRVKPEAEARRTLADDPRLNADLHTELRGGLSGRGWVSLGVYVLIFIFCFVVFVVLGN